MFKKLAPSVLLVVAVTLGASACSATNVQQSKFQSELKSKAKLTAAQAECVTKKVYDGSITQKDINKLYTADSQTDVSNTLQSEFTTIISNCISGKS